tara:strand:+ start:4891 stop:5163 length:273 start_codon:yes stop_codon:yes gene_type:complete
MSKKKDKENILGVNAPLPGEEHETEEDWAKDEDVQEFLEFVDTPGPWPEEDDRIYTVGGLTADKDRDFIKFQKKMAEREDFEGPNAGLGI